MDAAEAWLEGHDPDYEQSSRDWKHIIGGEYKCPPQEIPWGLSSDLALLVDTGAASPIEAVPNRLCVECGNEFVPREAKHRFCSDRCKMRDYRARKASAKASAVLWDLGANLPDGHPFAPRVDGKQAA